MRQVIINADDYAMDEEVDDGILKLARQGVVTATSAMVLSPRWTEAARALRDAPLSRGLHLDFTSPFGKAVLPMQGLLALTARSHARLLDARVFRREISAQLALFESCLGGTPGFVDGHQHCHHLPIIRDLLLDALADHYGADAAQIGIRICTPRHWRGVKAAIVSGTGAAGLSKLAEKRRHRANTDFAGVYNFAIGADLGAHWRSWLEHLAGPLPLVMCHVASRTGQTAASDPIRQARYREFDWLSSEEFQALRQRFSISPARWLPVEREGPPDQGSRAVPPGAYFP